MDTEQWVQQQSASRNGVEVLALPSNNRTVRKYPTLSQPLSVHCCVVEISYGQLVDDVECTSFCLADMESSVGLCMQISLYLSFLRPLTDSGKAYGCVQSSNGCVCVCGCVHLCLCLCLYVRVGRFRRVSVHPC